MQATEIDDLKLDLLEGMREYRESIIADGEQADYSDADVNKCGTILDNLLAQLQATTYGDKNAVKRIIEQAVLALNYLNNNCSQSLIETDQREQICEVIMQAAAAAGVGDGEDLTEEWREW